MSRKVAIKINKKLAKVLIRSIILLSLVIVVSSALLFFYSRVYPGVSVNNTYVGGMTQAEALNSLKTNNKLPEKINVSVSYIVNGETQDFTIDTKGVGANIDYPKSVSEIYQVGRSGNTINDINTIINSAFRKNIHTLSVNFDDQLLSSQIEDIVSQIKNQPVEPTLKLSDGDIEFIQGKPGEKLDATDLKNRIVDSLENGSAKVEITTSRFDPSLTFDEQSTYAAMAAKLKDRILVASSKDEDKKIVYKGQELLDLISPHGGWSLEKLSPSISEISAEVNTEPKNPVFTYANNRVQEFSPAKDGLEVDTTALSSKITDTLSELANSDTDEVSFDIPVKRTPPEISTGQANSLGINELVGEGTSSYRGSASSRIYNIALAASKLNGVLIKPGQVFSFDQALGDITAVNGYKQAYVIQGDQTILGDGGGVCQVSTTFFRAALDAGLPIIERHAHSYRVSYYEQGTAPGIDATIYYPTVDLKIKNNTPGYILVQAVADTKNRTLKFDFYGTKDGRVATTTKPVITEVTPPPDDLYIDDPTLPAGQIQQIDHKAWGAKVHFAYSVVDKDGNTTFSKTFYSNYQPWQAKFLRGVGPAN